MILKVTVTSCAHASQWNDECHYCYRILPCASVDSGVVSTLRGRCARKWRTNKLLTSAKFLRQNLRTALIYWLSFQVSSLV